MLYTHHKILPDVVFTGIGNIDAYRARTRVYFPHRRRHTRYHHRHRHRYRCCCRFFFPLPLDTTARA